MDVNYDHDVLLLAGKLSFSLFSLSYLSFLCLVFSHIDQS